MPQAQGKEHAQTPPPSSKQSQPLKRDGSRTHRVKVFRTDENKHAPISVCVNDPKNRKEFYPGQEVHLREDLIDALKMARLESSLEIPPGSAVYEAQDPKMEAQRMNPGYGVQADLTTGTLYLVKSEPKYLVEILD